MSEIITEPLNFCNQEDWEEACHLDLGLVVRKDSDFLEI